MKEGGTALWVLGLIVCGIALFGMDTTVSASSSYSYGGVTTPPETYNIGLVHNQSLVFIAGCALFVAGAAIHAIGAALAMILARIAAGGTQDQALVTAPAVEAVRPPVATPTYEPAPTAVPEPSRASPAFLVGFAIFVVAVLLFLGFVAGGKPDNAAAIAIEANADAMADNVAEAAR